MAPKKPAAKAKAKPAPLPPMPATGKKKEGVCGVDGYCCQGKSPEDCCGGSCGGNCGCGSPKASVFDCHILAMLKKRAFWLGSLVAFFTIALFQYTWHDIVLMPRYIEAPYVLRPLAEIALHNHLFFIHHALMAAVFTLLFLLLGGFSLLKGIKNGILIMSPLAICTIAAYAAQPVPAEIAQMWAIGYLLLGSILGFVLSIVASCNWCNGSAGGCCGGSCSTDGPSNDKTCC